MRDLLTALALVFVIEGLVLATLPSRLKQVIEMLNELGEDRMRQIGLSAVAIGIVGVVVLRFL